VLVVEDDPISSMMLRIALERDGLEVDVEGDGARAAARLEHERWDLVVTDIELPGIDGLALAERARKAPGSPAVLVMTAHARFDYAASALHSGATGFLTKPVDLDELRTKVAASIIGSSTRR
jgi:DNA-binding response OmpR family regulator